MKYKIIRTDVTNYGADATLDLGKIPGAMDVSFENVGAAIVTINTKAGSITLNPGDPMLTFGGYQGYFRNDFFNFVFGAGIKAFNVYINIHTNIDEC